MENGYRTYLADIVRKILPEVTYKVKSNERTAMNRMYEKHVKKDSMFRNGKRRYCRGQEEVS